METFKYLTVRDESASSDNNSYNPPMGPVSIAFLIVLFCAMVTAVMLVRVRRRRFLEQQARLPRYQPRSHHRSASVTNVPIQGRNEAVYVYDEKMNLIANSSPESSRAIPEIRITFPEEENQRGESKQGRVVVVHISDTGSIGMAPLDHEDLPPYQRHDNGRFQSLDLDRIGGLKEKDDTVQQRYS